MSPVFRNSRLPGATRDPDDGTVIFASHNPAAEKRLDDMLLLFLPYVVE